MIRSNKLLTGITICITLLAAVAASIGIFSKDGPGRSEYISVRGEKVLLYGKGPYKHMSAEVAPQGIAQDVVTLFIGIPLLLTGLFFANRNSFKGRLLHTGTLGYFLVTYLFYTVMAMYNELFLLWVVLLALSFYGFVLAFTSFDVMQVRQSFTEKLPAKFIGGFLVFSACAIAFLWLSIVVPPFIKGTIPKEVEHYTTLIVQALDLAILLPASFMAGVMLWRKKPFGYLIAPVYVIFLSVLMAALTAKVIAMAMLGNNVIPVIIIIPLFTCVALLCVFKVFMSIRTA